MKKLPIRICVFICILYLLPQSALAARLLIPVGQLMGLELKNGTVTVSGFAPRSCGKAAGLQEGDCILSIDGSPITCAQDVRNALTHTKGFATLTLRRDDREQTLRVQPDITADGPKLGIYLKEGITGIGTVTWYDPETQTFGALGHGVNAPKGKLLKLTQGNAYAAQTQSVRKGKVGAPGQLIGSVTATAPIGNVLKNTPQGLFGKAAIPYTGQALPVAENAQIQTGPATIFSCVQGQRVQEYSVEILKIYPAGRDSDRNMLIRITDPNLLEATGGIVQGMSGSPIIQNGKLIGAVTHVLVNDPTTGYGIFIENMLDAAA